MISGTARTDVVLAADLAQVVVLKGAQSSPLPVSTGAGGSATSAVTRVAVNVASVQLLALNAARRGATFNNNTAAVNMFLKLGTTANIGAGTESFTVRVPSNGYYEVPFGYTGRIDAIWDGADAAGEVLITELT